MLQHVANVLDEDGKVRLERLKGLRLGQLSDEDLFWLYWQTQSSEERWTIGLERVRRSRNDHG